MQYAGPPKKKAAGKMPPPKKKGPPAKGIAKKLGSQFMEASC